MANCFGCRYGKICTDWPDNGGQCKNFQGPALIEISISLEDDDNLEHEGYYNSVDDAIEALLKYKG